MMRGTWCMFLCLALFLGTVSSRRSKNDPQRDGKFLSLFRIVKFNNGPCIGGASKNGTCYTADECSTKGGSSSGTCAGGYGVCCTFTGSCGGQTNENCTYFESRGGEIGACRFKICPCSTNICQIRLDFNQFMISGPSTSTQSVSAHVRGLVGVPGATKPTTTASQCLTDTFSVLAPSGQSPPTICGINTAEHMYVDLTDACNDLVFTLGGSGQGAGIAQRQWSIKITQYTCDFPNLAPDGCTQYFFGKSTASVQTFNYAGGQHLANQDQNICIRRERGNCRICWTTIQETDFMTSGMTLKMGVANPLECCGYGSAGTGTKYDCVLIPGALKPTMMSKQGIFDQFCGRSAGLVSKSTTASLMSKTVCTDRQPFNIRFLSDGFENDMEILMGPMAGFKLAYIQNSDCN